jgi:formylglycine-generating enzyme required for sulfatase activity
MAAAVVAVDTVPVGHAGNVADLNTLSRYGSVGYAYRMGKFELTAGQYTDFLNAVAKTDTYGLYSERMGDAFTSLVWGCNIQRIGTPGDFRYRVAADWANRPVNWVSWGDAARFCNWLHNGQPTGEQGPATTEDGSYRLNGTTAEAALMAVQRRPGATWVIPSEDEWYKAAYHDPAAPLASGFWRFPTRTETIPSNALDPTGTNNGNFASSSYTSYTIGAPYWRTEVGAFPNSPSAYGTFDQGGNVWEWNEAVVSGAFRGNRGGAFTGTASNLLSGSRGYSPPGHEYFNLGFRVALVPEPATLALILLGGVPAILRRG